MTAATSDQRETRTSASHEPASRDPAAYSRRAEQAKLRVMRAVLHGSVFGEVLEEAVRQSAEALVAEYCALFRYEASRAGLVAEALAGWSGRDPGGWELSYNVDTHVGFTALSGKPYAFQDLSGENSLRNDHDLQREGIRSGLALPVRVGDEIWGVLAVHTRSRRKFSPEDHECLKTIAGCVASAVEHRQLHAEAARRVRRYEREIDRTQGRYALITSSAVELNHANDLPHALKTGARLIAQGLGDLCHIDLLERSRTGVHVRRIIAGGSGIAKTTYDGCLNPERGLARDSWQASSANGVETEEYQANGYVFEEDRVGMAGTPSMFRQPRPQLLNFDDDLNTPAPEIILDPRARALLEGKHIAAYMCVPLLSRGQLLGAVGVVAAGRRAYHETDLQLLDHLANLICLAMNSRTEDMSSSTSGQLQRAASEEAAIAFTQDQIQTLQELATGDTYEEIAARLNIAYRTLQDRVDRIAKRLGVSGHHKRHKVLAAVRALGYDFGKDGR